MDPSKINTIYALLAFIVAAVLAFIGKSRPNGWERLLLYGLVAAITLGGIYALLHGSTSSGQPTLNADAATASSCAGRTASWGNASPIVTPPPALRCTCVDAEQFDPRTATWQSAQHGRHQGPIGTKFRFTNNCPSPIQIFGIRDTDPHSGTIPVVQSANGRSFALENLNKNECVVFDPTGPTQGNLEFALMNCPNGYASPLPLNCVSDARLAPNTPAGPPAICPAQGPPNTQCTCNGRPGINFLGDPPSQP